MMRLIGLTLAVLMVLPVLGGGAENRHILVGVCAQRSFLANGQDIGTSDEIGVLSFCVNAPGECVADTTGSITVEVVPEGPSATCEERER